MLEERLEQIKQIKDIDKLQEELEKIERESSIIISTIKGQIKSLKTEQKELSAQELERFVKAIEKFAKTQSEDLAIKIVESLKTIDLKRIELISKDYTSADVRAKLKVVFDYFIDKQDIAMVEKFLLHQQGKTMEDAKQLDATEVSAYEKHLSEDGSSFTEKSRQIYAVDWTLRDEIEQFMEMLGDVDFKLRPEDCKDGKVYRSETFTKCMHRAICGAYGVPFKYVYWDGEYGHRDSERAVLTNIHDKAYEEREKIEQTTLGL